jgi:hypothetical protein
MARDPSIHAAACIVRVDICVGPLHLMTSSSAYCSVSGTVKPSALAVLRLMTSSELGRLHDRQVVPASGL